MNATSISAADLEAAMQAWLPRAESGDFVAMAYVAIILHLFNHSSSSREEINSWLRRAMVSDDAEFLAELGEELVIGTAIYRDLTLAHDCFKRVLTVSELMGSYVMARFLITRQRKQSLQYLQRAAGLGHVPSRQLLIMLQLPKNRIRRRLQGLAHLPRLFNDVRRIISRKAPREHWWRYQDVVSESQSEVLRELGGDRRHYFLWARPSSLGAFATVLAKGENPDLPRGMVDSSVLFPSPKIGALPVANPIPKNAPSALTRFAIQLLITGVLIAAGSWAFHFLSHFPSGPEFIVQRVPAEATFDVAFHAQDTPGIFETFTSHDFFNGGAAGSVSLSEPPIRDGDLFRGTFISLQSFDGTTGASSFSVLPFGWTADPLTVRVAAYGQCGNAESAEPKLAIRICIRARRPT